MMKFDHEGYRLKIRYLCLVVTIWLVVVAVYQTHKSIPDSLDYRGDLYSVDDGDLEFLFDLTYRGNDGQRIIEQQIFDTIFNVIDNARHYVLIDMFLFNGYGKKNGNMYRDLSKELTNRLIEKKRSDDQVSIDVITDPINDVYGGGVSSEITRLRKAGINVIITDLHKLRDSNFLYSAIWRTFLQWFAIFPCDGWLRHPFSAEGKVTLSGYLELLNFKANHRKVVIADQGADMVTIFTSANPHGGSSEHSNVGFVARGDIWRSVYETEQGIARMSGGTLSSVDRQKHGQEDTGEGTIRVLTEYRIKQAILDECKNADSSDSIKLAQFYMADRDIVRGLLNASENGVDVRIILDPNKDAFGYKKNGIPNRQIAGELIKKSKSRIQIRWYDTHGEQFHTKLFIKENDRKITVITGSANLTRRNLDNNNLEIDVMAEFQKKSRTGNMINAYFERIWNNKLGAYTVDYEVYRDDSTLKYGLYRLQEKFGLGTF